MASPKQTLMPSTDGPKITLCLRQLRYEKELALMKLPKDAEGIIKGMLRLRERMLADKYDMAFHFTLLKKQREFWKVSGHKSLDIWLASFDLPMGQTLAAREAMVRLFSRETFLLVGDDMLGEMIFEVARHQPEMEKRKRDYQKIFDAYCKSHDSFDKSEFRKILNWYINTRYIKPSGLRVVDNTARAPRTESKGTTSYKATQPVSDGEQSTPHIETDFVIKKSMCASCKLWHSYAQEWEAFAKDKSNLSELGAKRLPKRPNGLG